MKNGFVESFNGRMRDEFLDETAFRNLAHGRDLIAAWVDDYNTQRPHSALGYETPADYAQTLTTAIANRRKQKPGSGRSWMKVQWQVTRAKRNEGASEARRLIPRVDRVPGNALTISPLAARRGAGRAGAFGHSSAAVQGTPVPR